MKIRAREMAKNLSPEIFFLRTENFFLCTEIFFSRAEKKGGTPQLRCAMKCTEKGCQFPT